VIYGNRKEKLDQFAKSYKEGQRSHQHTSHEGIGVDAEEFEDESSQEISACLKEREAYVVPI
jgi:hypothetical protein